MHKPFRFGVQTGMGPSGGSIAETARQAEDLGYATVTTGDHFGMGMAPLEMLAFAAAATSTIRLGTMVLCNDFRHPAMLAKEVATFDVLSGGRFELGLGAGWMKAEYDLAGMPFDPPSVRIERMEEAIQVMKAMWSDGPASFTGDHYQIAGLDDLKPRQGAALPLLIGAGSPKIMGVAGRWADTVNISYGTDAQGRVLVSNNTAEHCLQKIEWLRAAAGDRFDDIELSMLSGPTLTDDRQAAAEAIVADMGRMPIEAVDREVTPEDVLDSPNYLIGTQEEIADQLVANRERFGISYIVVAGPGAMEGLAPVVERLAGT